MDDASTLDAFHRGKFWLVQPRRGGHRAGLDAMLLSAAVPSAFAGRLVDFGAGAGAAGLSVIARCGEARVTLVERSPDMADFARRTLEHAGNTAIAGRAEVLVADVALTGRAREEAGLTPGSFDFAIMNPPFNAAHDRATPDSLRREAHVMDDALFGDWTRSAAAVVRPKGGIAIIARPVSLPAILAAFSRRFGGAEILPVHPRCDSAAIRVVIRARRGSRAALRLLPPLVLHDGPGDSFSDRADAINNGAASLFGD